MTIFDKVVSVLEAEHGFDGVRSPEAVKEWAADQGFNFEFTIGTKTYTLDDIDNETKGIRIHIEQTSELEADAVEVVELSTEEEPAEEPVEDETAEEALDETTEDESVDEEVSDEEEEETESKSLDSTKENLQMTTKNFNPVAPAIHNTTEKRAYELAMKSGKAVFDDFDRAEYASAWMRSALAKSNNITDYALKSRDSEVIKAGSVGTATEGGNLAPNEFIPEISDLISRYGAARRCLNVYETDNNAIEIPKVNSRVTVGWNAENNTATGGTPNYGLVTVVTKDLLGYVPISKALFQTASLSVTDDLFRQLALDMARQEDEAFINGDGTDTYGGITGLKNVIGAGGKVTDTATAYTGFTDAYLQQLLGQVNDSVRDDQTKIITSRQFFWQVFNRLNFAKGGITYEVAQNGVGRYMYNGTEIVITAAMPSGTYAASTIYAFYGDFNQAAKMAMVRNSLEFATSEHSGFAANQLGLRAVERVGIVVHDYAGATTTGPFSAIQGS